MQKARPRAIPIPIPIHPMMTHVALTDRMTLPPKENATRPSRYGYAPARLVHGARQRSTVRTDRQRSTVRTDRQRSTVRTDRQISTLRTDVTYHRGRRTAQEARGTAPHKNATTRTWRTTPMKPAGAFETNGDGPVLSGKNGQTNIL